MKNLYADLTPKQRARMVQRWRAQVYNLRGAAAKVGLVATGLPVDERYLARLGLGVPEKFPQVSELRLCASRIEYAAVALELEARLLELGPEEADAATQKGGV